MEYADELRKKSIILAERLKALREEKGLSLEKLSELIEDRYGIRISTTSLINYEVASPDRIKLYKNLGMRTEYLYVFSDLYGVSTDYLLGLTNIRSADSSVQSIVNSTGLSEDSAIALHAIAKANGGSKSDPTEFKRVFMVPQNYPDVEYAATAAIASRFVNDMVEAISKDKRLLLYYGSLISTILARDNREDMQAISMADTGALLVGKDKIVVKIEDYISLNIYEVTKIISDYYKRLAKNGIELVDSDRR